jgi:uncharacterized protein YcfJ
MLIGGVVGAIAVTAVSAVAGYRLLDNRNYAEVLSVRPATRTVSEPREECRDLAVTRQRATKDPNQVAGTIAGAVVGGVVGSQIGGGDGKKLATVGGAVAGGYAGNKVQENMQERNTYQDTERACTTVYDRRQEPAGYSVTYRLDGREHEIRMDHDPGSRIPVRDDGTLDVT